LQAFSLKPTSNWLLLAVDLPVLTRASILHLLSSHPPAAPVSLYLHPSDGNPEPLFSVWTPHALEQLQKNCRTGKSGPCRAAKDVWGGKIVEGKGGVKVLGENWVTDADTPEEWEKAVQALSTEVSAAIVTHPLNRSN
jgi:molybdopterin-guanine dinucleotide biosynthesis protein A